MSNLAKLIGQHPFFAGVKSGHLAHICPGAREISLGPNEILFQEREPASCLYLVTEGEIAIEAHSRATRRTVRIDTAISGDVLGWSWLFPPYCWHFEARAVMPSHVISLDAAALLVRCEEDHELGFLLMKRTAQLAIRRLQHAREVLLELDATCAEKLRQRLTAPAMERVGH